MHLVGLVLSSMPAQMYVCMFNLLAHSPLTVVQEALSVIQRLYEASPPFSVEGVTGTDSIINAFVLKLLFLSICLLCTAV